MTFPSDLSNIMSPSRSPPLGQRISEETDDRRRGSGL